MPLMKVIEVEIDRIKVEDRHREEMGDIDALAENLKEKGILQPLTVDKNYRLLAGGRRLAAARKADFARVPVVVRNVDEIDAYEVELIENVFRKEMTWSERAKLEKKIHTLYTQKDPNWTQTKQADMLDVSKGAVSRRIQLAEYIEAVPELTTLKDEASAWKAVKKIEEQYLINSLAEKREKENGTQPDKDLGYTKLAPGHYRIGDCFEGMAKATTGGMHFAEVDPPYGIELDRRKSRTKNDNKMSNYNEIPGDQYVPFLSKLAAEVYRILDRNAFGIWWFGIEWYQDVLAELREVGFKVNPIPAIWYKGQQGQTASPDTMLGSSYETFFVIRKGDPKLAKPGRSNVFHYPPVSPARKIHATEKPIELMLDIMETFLYPGSRVLVPFLGSGVTLRACYRTNHIGVGWDLSKEHKDKFLMRVNEDHLLGIKPKLIKAAGEE